MLDLRKDKERVKAKIEKRKATSARRKEMRSISAICKIEKGKLSAEKRNYLEALFYEAKILRNAIVRRAEDRTLNLWEWDYKTTTIYRRVPASLSIKTRKPATRMLEPVELVHLSADMRIAILDELKNNIKGLAAAKRKGRRVGRLKYQKIADSIPLRGNTIHTNTNRWMTKTEDRGWIKISDGNHIKINGIPWKFKVRGIKQIQNGAEIRDAKLVRKADGYFIHISTSVPYDMTLPGNGLTVGIDMGIKHHITTSDGIKYKAVIDESTRLKRLQRAFSRTEKHSRNHRKIQAKIRRAYQRMVYKRDEEAHKVVNELLRTYDRIAIQNENITGWRKLFGSSIQGAILGRVKARIVALEKRDRAVVLDRKYPTTKRCHECGRKVVLSLTERTFTCSCGYSEDRDIKAAKTIRALATGDIIWNIESKRKPKQASANHKLPSKPGEVSA